MKTPNQPRYAGFWIRLLAKLIDCFFVLAVTLPLLLWVYGWEYLEAGSTVRGPLDFLISWLMPALAAVTFWRYRSATPGKMIVSARIVDQRTGQPPSWAQCIVRYFAYLASAVPLGMGFLWIAVDPRKQAWHDKLAGTVVTWGRRARMPAEKLEHTATAAAKPDRTARPSPWSDEPFDLSDPSYVWPEREAAQTASRYAFPSVAVPEMVAEESPITAR
jgi:uncharacterized RDD family membrane protein YckC